MKNSDKAYPFCKPGKNNTVCVFEAPIDLMSYLTLIKKHNIENFENHKGKNVITGRARNNKLVHIPSDTDRTGEFLNVKITGCKTWYLNGEII